MQNKNLLFLGPWPPPFGGISSHLYELLPGLVERGYNVISLSFTEDRNEITQIERGVNNIYFSPSAHFNRNKIRILKQALLRKNHRKGLGMKKYIRALTIADRMNVVLNNENIDFVFTYDNDQLHVTPFIEKKEGEKPKIFCSIYGAFFLHPNEYANEKPFLRHAISFAEKVLSCSKYCADSGKEYLNMDYPTQVIYNNVDKDLYKPENDGSAIRKRHGISEEQIVLMLVGRIGVDMGADFLLREIDRLTAIDPNLIVFFVGARAELCDEVERAAQTNSQVRFAFNIPMEEKELYFAACDIFTAPTKEKHACMGIANIEAMMSGKPVISSTSGGHPETIEDGVSGILVSFENGLLNGDKYIEKLTPLVQNPEMRAEYGKRGRERGLRLFTNEQIVQEHLDIIEEYTK